MSEGRRPWKVSDEEIVAAARRAGNMRQLLQLLGLAAYGGNYDTMRRRLAVMGLTDAAFQPKRRGPRLADLSREQLERAARCSDGYASMLRALGIAATGNAHRDLKLSTLRLGIDTSHFVGRAHNRGQVLGTRAVPLSQVLVAGRPTQTSTLKRRLLEAGLLETCCATCGRSVWNDAPIPLELDHINGDRTDNRLTNLRLLCPNCHAQTPTYRGRNIGRPRQRPAVATELLPDLNLEAAIRLHLVLSRPA